MPLIELRCVKCGKVYEELCKADGHYPPCKECGGATEQVYNGKLIVCAHHSDGECSGNCSSCGGCHH